MTKIELNDIIRKLSGGTGLSSTEINNLVDYLTNTNKSSSSYFNNGSKQASTEYNKLNDLLKEEDDLRKEIVEIIKNEDKLDDEKQKKLTEELIKLKNIKERISEIEEIDNLRLRISTDINKEHEKLKKKLEQQYEIHSLTKKEISEGLTLEEKKHKLLLKIADARDINLTKIKKGISEIKKGLTDIKSGIDKLNEPWAKVDQVAADYTKRIGGSIASMNQLRKSTIDFMETRNIGINYNTSMEELIKLQGDYNACIGRSISLTNDQKETFAAMKSVIGEQETIEFTTKLENFGLNPDEVGDRVGKMFSKASKSGIAFEKYSKNFLNNIQMAQNYTFTNGLKGLESMAKKATEIKFDMQQAARMADKVSTLEGAMQAGASLSVLGGSFAQYGNPLSMMYEGLNDMEGLQDRITKMFGGMSKWDYSKGQVDVSVFDKQRIKAAAEATGMDYSALMESINANARREIVSGKLGGKFNSGSDTDNEMRELILNLAQLDEKGNAFVTVNGERKGIDELKTNDIESLRSENNSDSDNIKEIAINTRGFKDISEGFAKQKDVAGASFNEMTGIGETTKQIMNDIGNNNTIMKILAAGDPMLHVTNGLLGTINGILLIMNSKLGVGGSGASMGKVIGGEGGMNSSGGNHGGKGKGGFFTKAKNSFKANGGAYGAAATLVGGAVDYGTTMAYRDKEKDGGYVAGKTVGKALEFAGTGAMIGSMFGGPIGTLVGAGIGAIGGGIYGWYSASQEKEKDEINRSLKKKYNFTVNPDNYSVEEMKALNNGSARGVYGLRDKMIANGELPPGWQTGGYTGDGNPNEVAGVVHKGEFVIPSKEVNEIKSNGNILNSLGVKENVQKSNNISSGVEKVKVEIPPIKIDGKIELVANGNILKNIPADEIITKNVMDYIIREIEKKTNYALNKDNVHQKYG